MRTDQKLVTLGLLFLVAACGTDSPGDSAKPDVLLITIDTLRADQVHAYGFPLQSTPNLDGLAERGALFETAIAASSRTVPSHASMFSSRWVREHSVGTFNGSSRLEGVDTLAERFRAAGYETAAFLGNFVLTRRTGLDQGFDVYDDELPALEENREGHFERAAEATAQRALAWLSDRRGDRPVFLWVHFQDPHGPYAAPSTPDPAIELDPPGADPELPVLDRDTGRAGIPRYQAIAGVRRPSAYRQRYAEEVAYTDFWLGRLVGAFEELSPDRGKVILATSDHGESFGESGYFFQHGQFASPEQTLVPFIVVAPGISQGRHATWVSHVDVAPTLLELAGLPPIDGASGLSLVPLLQEGEPLPPRILYAEAPRELSAYGDGGYLRVRSGPPRSQDSLRNPLNPDGELRLARYRRSENGRWKAVDRPDRLPADVESFLRTRVPKADAASFSREDVERLRALGYLPE